MKTILSLLSLLCLCLAGSASHGQTIIKNFPGLTLTDTTGLGTGATPPDTMGAAGTNHFVEFINGAFAVYDKSGNRQSLVTDTAFWLNAGISAGTMSAGLSDPRIIYDAGSGRWFVSEITVDNSGNKVLIGRSDSSDPGGTWKATNMLANSNFGDFDTLGVDSLGIYVGLDNFRGNNLTGVSFLSLPKTDLLASPPSLARLTRFDNISDQTYGFALQGVCNAGTGPGHGVIIAIDNAAFNFFDRTTVNGPGGAGVTLSSRVRIPITYDAAPNPATQPGGNTVDAGDDRFASAVKQVGGYIFMANNILQGSKDAVHWLVLNETNNTVVGEGIVSDPSYDYFEPSIIATPEGNLLMAFNRCGTASPAGDISIYAVAGTFTNGTVTMGLPFLLKTGTVSNFAVSFDSAPYRWGDYSTTMADPTDDNLVWTIQEIPASSSTWGTQVTLLSFATNAPALTLSNPGSNLVLGWPLSTDPAYLLQSSTNLSNPAGWTTVTNSPVVSDNQNYVTLIPTNQLLFFRLKK